MEPEHKDSGQRVLGMQKCVCWQNGSSHLSAGLHLQSTVTQAALHSCGGPLLIKLLKQETNPTCGQNLLVTAQIKEYRRMRLCFCLIALTPAETSSTLLPKHSFTCIRTSFFDLPVQTEDQQLSRPPVPGRDCQDIQHHRLTSFYAFGFSSV